MNYSRQSGVALVQVLLISALLLLLVVQLSKNASNSARIATQLKEKAAAGVKSQTNFANAQYLLITQQKDFQLNWMGRNSINFSSDARQVEPSVYVELQDLAGLLSTSFFGQEWLSFVKSDQQKLETVKSWQGYGDDRFGSSNNRNARIPYIEEIRLLGDWRTDELQYLTYFPTGFFNVATAPESLLRLVYPGDIVNQIVELRRTNKLDRGSRSFVWHLF